MDTITNYDGRAIFSVPATRRQLLSIVGHPDSDGCTFTYDMLGACKSQPPRETKEDHTFAVCLGELHALDASGSTTHLFDEAAGSWVKWNV